MARVIIELEFEADDVTEADVINYVNELIENDCLAFEIIEASEEWRYSGVVTM
tara:strand:+ start:563 stop:721 length:159 start_codon:yes stop_codon:yes gene_type:complete